MNQNKAVVHISFEFWQKTELKQHEFDVKMHILNRFVSKQYTNFVQVLRLFIKIHFPVFHKVLIQMYFDK